MFCVHLMLVSLFEGFRLWTIGSCSVTITGGRWMAVAGWRSHFVPRLFDSCNVLCSFGSVHFVA